MNVTTGKPFSKNQLCTIFFFLIIIQPSDRAASIFPSPSFFSFFFNVTRKLKIGNRNKSVIKLNRLWVFIVAITSKWKNFSLFIFRIFYSQIIKTSVIEIQRIPNLDFFLIFRRHNEHKSNIKNLFGSICFVLFWSQDLKWFYQNYFLNKILYKMIFNSIKISMGSTIL